MNIKINNNIIGANYSTYIIAEMSANHNQDFDQAVKIIQAVKEAGANAIKLQTYTPDTLTIDCDNDYFKIGTGTIWQGKNLYELYGEAYTPWDWQPKLKEVAEDLGLDFFSTPFDESAVDFLEKINVPAYKVASFELVDIPLLKKVAKTGKPVIMSTGMASLAEIDEAVNTLKKAGNNQLALLKCTSTYPAMAEDINLHTIPHLAEAFDTPVGLSDHTLGIAVPVAAVAFRASIIEKHFTLSRQNPGPDSSFSLEFPEFKEMVDAIRIAEKALGRVNYDITEKQKENQVFRRSLFIVKNIKKGEKFTEVNVRSIRPGYGLHTRYLDKIIGKYANMNLKRGTPLDWQYIK